MNTEKQAAAAAKAKELAGIALAAAKAERDAKAAAAASELAKLAAKAKDSISAKVAREYAKQGKELTGYVDSKGRKFLRKDTVTILQGEIISTRSTAVRDDKKPVATFIQAINEGKTFENGNCRVFFKSANLQVFVSIDGKKPVAMDKEAALTMFAGR